MNNTEIEFTTLMRRKTRRIHNLSDTLVHSKLFLFGFIDDNIWAEGLLLFSYVFQYLEDCMERLPPESNVCKFKNSTLMRSKYFDIDLENYYGKNWKKKPLRKSVIQYLQHLKELEETQPNLLIAYIYHLYLGLLSGGQILRFLREKRRFSIFSPALLNCCVVDIDKNTTKQLKTFIKVTTNDIARTLNHETKTDLLNESITVFQLNCKLIQSINTFKPITIKIFYIIILLSICVLVIYSVLLFLKK